MRLMNSIFLCFAFLFLTGWGHWGSPVKIGLAMDSAKAHEPLVQKLKEAAEDNRAELLMKDAQGDPAAQSSEVHDLIQQGIQVLVVIPCDPSKALAMVSEAHQAGIKVVSLKGLIPNSDLDYLIAFDDVKAGELQARAMVKKVPRGRYVLLGGDEADEASQNFRKGQMKALQPLIERGDIQIAASKWDTARKSPEPDELGVILAREKNKVDVVLVSDGEKAEQAVRSLEKMNLKAAVGGVGDDLATCQRIASGAQWMTIYHPPQKLAEETAYLAAKLARKATEFDCQFVEVDNGSQKVQAVLLTPLVVDAGNLKSTVIEDQVQKEADVSKK